MEAESGIHTCEPNRVAVGFYRQLRLADCESLINAHLFRMGKKNCIMFMNDLTRYQVFLYGIKKEHVLKLEEVFLINLQINLRADDFPEDTITEFISNMGKIIYTKTHNRSILGSINDQAFITEHWIQKYLTSKELNIVELNTELNDSVILKIKENCSRLALKNALNVNN